MRFTTKRCLGLLLASSTTFSRALASTEELDFHDFCAQGEMKIVMKMVEKDTTLLDSYGTDGETCLMLSSIQRSVSLAKYLIENGANVNARALGEGNHRMPVLAWHALSGNHEVVELLLQQDLIEVNAEFDGIDDQGNMMDLFTVLDLMEFVIEAPNRMDEPPEMKGELQELLDDYLKVKELLINAGAKTFLNEDEL